MQIEFVWFGLVFRTIKSLIAYKMAKKRKTSTSIGLLGFNDAAVEYFDAVFCAELQNVM